MSFFRQLPLAAIDPLVRQLGSSETVRLLQADPKLLPSFRHSLQRQLCYEDQAPERVELRAAIACWPYLLNGIPGASGTTAELPGGYMAVTRDEGDIGQPLLEWCIPDAGDRYAFKTIRTPGQPDITYISMAWDDDMGVIVKVRPEGTSAADTLESVPQHCQSYLDPESTFCYNWDGPWFTIAAFVKRPGLDISCIHQPLMQHFENATFVSTQPQTDCQRALYQAFCRHFDMTCLRIDPKSFWLIDEYMRWIDEYLR